MHSPFINVVATLLRNLWDYLSATSGTWWFSIGVFTALERYAERLAPNFWKTYIDPYLNPSLRRAILLLFFLAAFVLGNISAFNLQREANTRLSSEKDASIEKLSENYRQKSIDERNLYESKIADLRKEVEKLESKPVDNILSIQCFNQRSLPVARPANEMIVIPLIDVVPVPLIHYPQPVGTPLIWPPDWSEPVSCVIRNFGEEAIVGATLDFNFQFGDQLMFGRPGDQENSLDHVRSETTIRTPPINLSSRNDAFVEIFFVNPRKQFAIGLVPGSANVRQIGNKKNLEIRLIEPEHGSFFVNHH